MAGLTLMMNIGKKFNSKENEGDTVGEKTKEQYFSYGVALFIYGGGITALRKSINSNLKKNGVPATMVAIILGHSPEVNGKYYTYDTSNLAVKQKIIKDRNAKVTLPWRENLK